ncbi:MAG: OmpA family protein [Burkholderiales bacterium]|nr:OmpA family protein [Burkholderiales bacterium]
MTNVRISAALFAALLAGCAADGSNQRTVIGAGTGAVLGGVLGKQVGGDRKGTAIGAVAGGVIGGLVGRQMDEQKRKLEQATQGTGIQVTKRDDNSLLMNVPNEISFDTDRADIKPAFRSTLDKVASVLNENTATNIMIVGHTDSTGTSNHNQALSFNRANSTRTYLASRSVGAGRMAVDGRGESQPIASNDTSDGKARNRRVEIAILPPPERQQ